MERVLESIREADVISILFTCFRKSLVTTCAPPRGTALRGASLPVARPEDRLAYIRKQRPSCRAPPGPMFPWSRERRQLRAARHLRGPAGASGGNGYFPVVYEVRPRAAGAVKFERQEMVAVIAGENYYNGWFAGVGRGGSTPASSGRRVDQFLEAAGPSPV